MELSSGERPQPGMDEESIIRRGRINFSYLAKLDIRVPMEQSLNMENSYGDILIKGVNGEMDVNNKSGEVRIENCGSELELQNSYALVSISDFKGSVDVKNTSGEVSLTNITGTAYVYNGYKPVALSIPEEADVAISASTQYGKIRSDFPVYLQEKDTKSVKVELGKANIVVRVETSGDITIRKKKKE